MAEYMCQYYSLGFCFVFSPVESLRVTDQQFVGFSEITGMECKTFGKSVIFPSKMLKSFFQASDYHFQNLLHGAKLFHIRV